MNNEHYVTNAGIRAAAFALAAVCGGFFSQAETIEIRDAPFRMPAITVPEFPDRNFAVTDFGAKADGTKCTEAFAAAMAACERAGGGHVVVPAGKWLTGAVRFRNNCDLRLKEGAVLEFTDDPADYPEVHTTWEGIECYNHSPLLFAYGVTNVAITGSGTIAPRMDFWRTWFARPPEHMAATEKLYYWCSTNAAVSARRLLRLDRAHMRPHLIQFNRCGNVLLDGFRIRESPFWMIHLYHSENCVVRNLDTYAHGHNNDGVDVDMTKNVLIENCHFDQGDDGVVLKAGRNADAWRLDRCTENVVVRDCDMEASHSLLGIGSELSGGIRNVWMTRCTVSDTYSMLRIKTGPRRGGFVENIWMDHCRGKRVYRVFNIFMKYCAQWGRFPDFERRRTRIRNINVSDCEAELASLGLELEGDERQPPSGIRISNVKVGRVIQALTEIRDCTDVRIDGLALGPAGNPDFKFATFVAKGESAEAFRVAGKWEPILRQLRVGDRVILRFPPSSRRDDFVTQVRGLGGIPVIEPWKARLFFAGDSTLDDAGLSLGGDGRYPYASWGTTLRTSMADGCGVANYARSGASTKSFVKSGLWRKLIDEVRQGDFVAIQFGHNDQKRSNDFYRRERWADPKGLFREIVRDWVKDIRAKGATPVLLSPICRGTFDGEGRRLVDTEHAADGVCLGSYRDAMRELSEELKCDYVDMNGLTRELMEKVGKDEAMKFFVVSTGYVRGKDGEPAKDTTHPCKAGAEAFAELFRRDVMSRNLPIAALFR